MIVSIRPDCCIALRMIAAQEHYRKSQEWLDMIPEWERLVEVASHSQAIIKMQAVEIEKLRSALRLIFSCGVQQEDVLSNKYKIVIPEYVLSEVEGLMNEAMGKRDD